MTTNLKKTTFRYEMDEMDPDINSTIASSLVVTKPRKKSNTTAEESNLLSTPNVKNTDQGLFSPLDTPFRSLEDQISTTPYHHMSSFSRTPGPSMKNYDPPSPSNGHLGSSPDLHSTYDTKPLLENSQSSFNLFPTNEKEKTRFQYFMNDQTPSLSSPLVHEMLSPLLMSYSPTPEKPVRNLNFMDKDEGNSAWEEKISRQLRLDSITEGDEPSTTSSIETNKQNTSNSSFISRFSQSINFPSQSNNTSKLDNVMMRSNEFQPYLSSAYQSNIVDGTSLNNSFNAHTSQVGSQNTSHSSIYVSHDELTTSFLSSGHVSTGSSIALEPGSSLLLPKYSSGDVNFSQIPQPPSSKNKGKHRFTGSNSSNPLAASIESEDSNTSWNSSSSINRYSSSQYHQQSHPSLSLYNNPYANSIASVSSSHPSYQSAHTMGHHSQAVHNPGHALPPLIPSSELRQSNDSGRYSTKSSSSTPHTNTHTHHHQQPPLTISNPNGHASNPPTNHPNSNDLIDSPRSKAYLKDFLTKFRTFSKTSSTEAEEFALHEVDNIVMSENIKWKIYLELAELAKKNDDHDKARDYYIRAACCEKRSSTIWLEWSKMEEENGRFELALEILKIGLSICKISFPSSSILHQQHNDTLLPRLIKLYERFHQYGEIRSVLSRLHPDQPIDKIWKSILEGCLFELRLGNLTTARLFLNYLMKYVPWYGPIYYEAYRLEEREKRTPEAFSIIRRGLQELPRYGPLWFGLLRMMEKKDNLLERRFWLCGMLPHHSNLVRECKEALKSISKELTWRVYYEQFEVEERSAKMIGEGLYLSNNLTVFSVTDSTSLSSSSSVYSYYYDLVLQQRGKKSLIQAMLLCPSNLRWKLYLVAGRLEIFVGNLSTARQFAKRAMMEVPMKSKSTVLIECSRLEEFAGNLRNARALLKRGRNEYGNHDWRIFFEGISFEIRHHCYLEALEIAKLAIHIHNGTGRIWAIYIQLFHRMQQTVYRLHSRYSPFFKSNSGKSLTVQSILQKAIQEVPKSGEVWCELGRYSLNPLLLSSSCFNLQLAQRSFMFAIQFTPQYGDTFIEYLRYELIMIILVQFLCEEFFDIDYNYFIKEFCNCDPDSDSFIPNTSNQSSIAGSTLFRKESFTIQERQIRQMRLQQIHSSAFEEGLRQRLFSRFRKYANHSFEGLMRRCVNADPNYGSLWFYCRKHPHDVANVIFQQAQFILTFELMTSYPIYCQAILHYVQRCVSSVAASQPSSSVAVHQFLDDVRMSSSPSFTTHDHSHPSNEEGEELDLGIVSLPDGHLYCLTDFITGIVAMNRIVFNFGHAAPDVKKKYLFDIDQIIS